MLCLYSSSRVLRVMVTGGAGFIGSHLVRSLSRQGYKVLALDNLSRSPVKRLEELSSLGVKFVVADVRSSAVLDVISEFRPDYLVHCAALVSVEESFRKPMLYHAVNTSGTLKLALACKKKGVRRMVYISSAAVYGNPVKLPVDENHPTRPLSPYGASKLAGEGYVMSLADSRFKPISLRLFNVYGSGQNPEYAGVISAFLDRVSREEPLVIHGDGLQTRDFVFIDDVLNAIVRALETDYVGVVNIGSGTEVSIRDLCRLFGKLVGGELKVVYSDPRPGDIRRSVAKIEEARRRLGWTPRTSLEDGLRRLLSEYYRDRIGSD